MQSRFCGMLTHSRKPFLPRTWVFPAVTCLSRAMTENRVCASKTNGRAASLALRLNRVVRGIRISSDHGTTEDGEIVPNQEGCVCSPVTARRRRFRSPRQGLPSDSARWMKIFIENRAKSLNHPGVELAQTDCEVSSEVRVFWQCLRNRCGDGLSDSQMSRSPRSWCRSRFRRNRGADDCPSYRRRRYSI